MYETYYISETITILGPQKLVSGLKNLGLPKRNKKHPEFRNVYQNAILEFCYPKKCVYLTDKQKTWDSRSNQ